jgi:hypothetical protein
MRSWSPLWLLNLDLGVGGVATLLLSNGPHDVLTPHVRAHSVATYAYPHGVAAKRGVVVMRRLIVLVTVTAMSLLGLVTLGGAAAQATTQARTA